MDDTIRRQAAIELASGGCHPANVAKELAKLPPVEAEPSEITDEQAILHLQSTGWMQNHDREVYESGQRKQLADDSGGYDSLIPCEDTISRQAALDALTRCEKHCIDMFDSYHIDIEEAEARIAKLPSAQPETDQIRWERDTAIQQLADLGYSLGEKPRADKDTISRQAAIELASGGCHPANVAKELAKLPSAEPERKRGKWVSHKLENGEESIDKDVCSECGKRFSSIEETGCIWNFCPDCGSYNGGEQE